MMDEKRTEIHVRGDADDATRTTHATGAGDHMNRGGDANRDPITGEPGSHPVGTTVGGAGGAAVGAAIGAVGGPVGALVGGAIGAVAGGLAGHGAAEAVNPTVEDEYWRQNYGSRPYADKARTYEEYQPAYRYGWESQQRYQGRTWEDAEPEMERGWEGARGTSKLGWTQARDATRDAWSRVERKGTGSVHQGGSERR